MALLFHIALVAGMIVLMHFPEPSQTVPPACTLPMTFRLPAIEASSWTERPFVAMPPPQARKFCENNCCSTSPPAVRSEMMIV